MTDNLVERLDARARQNIAATPFNLLMDAKERIEQLTAERDGLLRCVTDSHVALCRAEAAEAERDRLQSALRHIVTYLAEPTVAFEDTLNSLRGDLRFVGRVASAALKGETP